MTFGVGDEVWLSTRNLKTSRPSKKLEYKRAGPYTVSKIINKNAYTPDLPKTMRNHNIFHVSLLDPYTPPAKGQPSQDPHPMIVEDKEEWEVDRILDSSRCDRRLHFLVHCGGKNHICTSWEPAEHLKNSRDLVDKFHRESPNWPEE
jgi:hypothetical protein